MANTRVLVKRRKSVKNTRKITKTMEMVSTAKLAKAQNAAISARPYAQKLREVIGELAKASSSITHPLLENRPKPAKAVVILLTSDRGLCAGFNANNLRAERRLAKELADRGLSVEYIIQGKKAATAFKYLGIKPVAAYLGVSAKPEYSRAEEIANGLILRFIKGEIDEAYLVFSRFKSMVNQIPTVEKILPLAAMSASDKDGRVVPGPGAGYLFHPDPQRILKDILPLVVKMSVFTAMLDNTAGEHAARRLAMKNATEAADDMIKMLSRQYNRARQSKITQEIAEIVGGAAALE